MVRGAEADSDSALVAALPDRDSFVLRAATASSWSDLPVASAGQLASALRLAGFTVHLAGPDHLLVRREAADVVYIPLKQFIHPGMLAAILETAGVSVSELRSYLARDEAREHPPGSRPPSR